MSIIQLDACTPAPLGSYLKSLGVFRLIAEQAGGNVRGWWSEDTFVLECDLTRDELLEFFLTRYEPTPIVAPWNGGSGFYTDEDGISAIEKTTDQRFREYRQTISVCRAFPEVLAGRENDDKVRRTAILRRCRNLLSDRAIEWLDAVIGIDAEGDRSFPPILGTGGNEGRLDYTNNFMSRIAALLIQPNAKLPVRELLANALFGDRTAALQAGAAAGQYDPGRAGGANQGPGVGAEAFTNPWDLVLTLEGAVAWSSGLYRRQGAGNRSILCSPFTVQVTAVAYGSASKREEAWGEVWTPLWRNPVRYAELKKLLREGRASVDGRAARNGLEFVEAAASLGVDRGIDRFVRYSLLKRRGKSYIALPTSSIVPGYRRNADHVRELRHFLDVLRSEALACKAELDLRATEEAMYQALVMERRENMQALARALGRELRRLATTTDFRLPNRELNATEWLRACGFEDCPEVRIAAALASIWTRGLGSLTEQLLRSGRTFAWYGSSLPARMTSVLQRRILSAATAESEANPLEAGCEIDPGDAALFVDRSVDDRAIEEFLFAFLTLSWKNLRLPAYDTAKVLPAYAVMKSLFLGRAIPRDGEMKRLAPDLRVLSALGSRSIADAAAIAVNRLRIAEMRPLDVTYSGGVDADRLAAALLIPVWRAKLLKCGILHEEESTAVTA
jgi:CRISPR-associated protein Csx17